MRKTKVVIKWGVANAKDKDVALFTHSTRKDARLAYKGLKALGEHATRPFKIYVEL